MIFLNFAPVAALVQALVERKSEKNLRKCKNQAITSYELILKDVLCVLDKVSIIY